MNRWRATLDSLASRGAARALGALQRGVEKESLRVAADGALAQTEHPRALGAPLTHPHITTDYSEALIEFVTAVHTDIDALLDELFALHAFTHQNLGEEKLWVNSMPCIVRGEEQIPIARYGQCNIARMKEVYRNGLQLRYGGFMQTIAGVHFNFSLPRDFWAAFLQCKPQAMQAQQSAHYFALIRNFHRLSWLGCYLFGASPAVCKSFMQGREHLLDELDSRSYYSPWATSLRLSKLGYSSNAQADIAVNYNGVDEFVASLRRAIQTPHPPYQQFGVKVDGQYRQLNANLLQIENEFYSVIRPKRVCQSGESPTRALATRGVEYVEVRSLDLNPFAPTGIDADCVRFFDLLLLYCMLSPSAPLEPREWRRTVENRRRVVLYGRKPNLLLCTERGEVEMNQLARTVFDDLAPLAQLLDAQCEHGRHVESLNAQRAKIDEPTRTPSAQILSQMKQYESFYEFADALAQQHQQLFKNATLSPTQAETMQQLAADSHQHLQELERDTQPPFDDFLADYFRRQRVDAE